MSAYIFIRTYTLIMVSSKYNFDRSLSEYFYELCDIYKRSGIRGLYSDVIGHIYARVFDRWHYSTIRKHLPVTGYVKYNDMIVENKNMFDELFFRSFYTDNPTLEEQYVKYIRKYVEAGENVNIIGGRYGVSTAAAGKKVGEDGSVTTFEATAKGCEQTEKTIKLNDLENVASVVQAVIGCAVSIKLENEYKKHPEEISDCDTLAIDCDGCEFEVLQKISSTPKRLIIEHHSVYPTGNDTEFKYDKHKLEKIVESKGYLIVDEWLEDDCCWIVAEKYTIQ